MTGPLHRQVGDDPSRSGSGDQGEPIRVFVAIELPQPVREALRKARDEIRAAGADMRWVAEENLHLSLVFLGDVTRPSMASIHDALNRLAGDHAPFDLRPHGIGAFPGPSRPRVVWAGCAGDAGLLLSLAGRVETLMASLGYVTDKPFRPHITLGRARERFQSRSHGGTEPLGWKGILERFRDRSFPSFPVQSIALIRSDLRPIGPLYSCLKRFPLSRSS